MDGSSREMDPMKAQQLAAELEVEMMADMYNRYEQAAISFTIGVFDCGYGLHSFQNSPLKATERVTFEGLKNPLL